MTRESHFSRLFVHSRYHLHKHRLGAKRHLQRHLQDLQGLRGVLSLDQAGLEAREARTQGLVLQPRGSQDPPPHQAGSSNRISQAKGNPVQPGEAVGMAGAEVVGAALAVGAGAGEARVEAP